MNLNRRRFIASSKKSEVTPASTTSTRLPSSITLAIRRRSTSTNSPGPQDVRLRRIDDAAFPAEGQLVRRVRVEDRGQIRHGGDLAGQPVRVGVPDPVNREVLAVDPVRDRLDGIRVQEGDDL